jgi:hypothetical protein
MNYQQYKKTLNEEVMLFKDGYEHVPFSTDENSKAHHYLGKIFERLNSPNSVVKLEPTNIGNKAIFYIHKDDVSKIFYCLDRIYKKTQDKEILDWVNDIKYHLLHYKSV